MRLYSIKKLKDLNSLIKMMEVIPEEKAYLRILVKDRKKILIHLILKEIYLILMIFLLD
jgi:hypothetical protein